MPGKYRRRRTRRRDGLVVRLDATTSLRLFHASFYLLQRMVSGWAATSSWRRGPALAALRRKGLVERAPHLDHFVGRPVYVPSDLGVRVCGLFRRRLNALTRLRRRQARQGSAPPHDDRDLDGQRADA
jgi:hypothetical protein